MTRKNALEYTLKSLGQNKFKTVDIKNIDLNPLNKINYSMHLEALQCIPIFIGCLDIHIAFK